MARDKSVGGGFARLVHEILLRLELKPGRPNEPEPADAHNDCVEDGDKKVRDALMTEAAQKNALTKELLKTKNVNKTKSLVRKSLAKMCARRKYR